MDEILYDVHTSYVWQITSQSHTYIQYWQLRLGRLLVGTSVVMVNFAGVFSNMFEPVYLLDRKCDATIPNESKRFSRVKLISLWMLIYPAVAWHLQPAVFGYTYIWVIKACEKLLHRGCKQLTNLWLVCIHPVLGN
jgi:hypothetical protein